MSTAVLETIVDPEYEILEAIREYGADVSPASLITRISRNIDVPESAVREAIWGLMANGRIELSDNRRLRVL